MKKSKTPMALRFIGWAFPKIEAIFPKLAQRWFVTLFFKPVRYKLPVAEIDMASRAHKYSIDFQHKKIQVYEWGQGPVVLFVHGWMGRATQFRKFIPQYVQAGYKVVSFDATGHGHSDGKNSHLMEFAAIIQRLAESYGQFMMVVGHSLGGVAALHAVKEGAKTDKLVMISSPTISSEILNEFLKRLNASRKCEQYFQKHFLKKHGKSFKEYSASEIITDVHDIDLLLIHDENDPEVSLANPQAILAKYDRSKLMTTKGLGHTRVLKDDEVIHSTLEFLMKRHMHPVLT